MTGSSICVDANAALPGGSWPLGWADYDNDGRLDIYLSFPDSVSSSLRVYRNRGNGTFSENRTPTSGNFYSYMGPISWADYNNDGDLDVLVGGDLFQNNNLISNSPPIAPTELTASRAGNLITLRWNPSTDPNQTGGLTYNVQVGTASGVYNIRSGEADNATGWRRVARPGPCSQPVWKFDLPVGTYYWRAQAIDHSQAGSPFSAEATFTIPPQPPRVLTLGVITNDFGQLLMTGNVNPNTAATVAWFDFGPTAAYGSSTPPQPMGNGTSSLGVSNVIYSYLPGVSYHYRAVASNSFGVSLGTDVLFVPPAFVEMAQMFIPGGIYSSAATGIMNWSDYDSDGRLDLIGNALVLHNDLTRMTNRTDLPGAQGLYYYPGPALGDYRGTDNLDILAMGPQLTVFRNDNGQFSNAQIPLTGYTATWFDYNNDGRLDILTSGAGPTQLYRNEGRQMFTQQSNGFPSLSYATMAWGDYDNDGNMDVILTGYGTTNGICSIFHNNGNGLFTDINAGLPGLQVQSLSWGDFDNDGDLDLLMSASLDFSNSVTRIYRNDGGVFTQLQPDLPGTWSGGAAWGDYDADGYLDIAITGYTNNYGSGNAVT